MANSWLLELAEQALGEYGCDCTWYGKKQIKICTLHAIETIAKELDDA